MDPRYLKSSTCCNVVLSDNATSCDRGRYAINFVLFIFTMNNAVGFRNQCYSGVG